jgi:membrane fusion protein, copper/silver efflux system
MRTSIYIFSFLLFLGCSREGKKDTHTDHTQAANEAAKYTCPMHPEVIRDEPGKCPICGMALVKVRRRNEASNDLMLSNSQIKLANITTERVTVKPVGQTILINGRLTADEQQTEVISSRAAGRIEKLYVRETGQTIRKGAPLYTLYSEMLTTLQQEYLLAKEEYEALGKTEKRYGSFLKAAEKKLLLYGMSREQISSLTGRNSIQPAITFLAPSTGVVTEINASEGQYLTEGSVLYKIEDISGLWVEAELYPNETSFVKVGDKITVRLNGDGDPIEARINFLSPEFRANSQITIMRARIENRGLAMKPGQQVQVYLTHSSRNSIALPVDAVIRNGKGAHVYIQTGNNTFRPRMVKTGLESFDEVEITEGIKAGDTVAVSGAYLLYSEIVLKRGSDPMEGHFE